MTQLNCTEQVCFTFRIDKYVSLFVCISACVRACVRACVCVVCVVCVCMRACGLCEVCVYIHVCVCMSVSVCLWCVMSGIWVRVHI